MPVADLPIAVVVASSEQQSDIIEVVASRAGEALKIDRRTYQVRETPHSIQKDAVQLLRGLPTVTIAPDDRILVLGAGVAQIYVDGRPYIGDASLYLRTLHGSDIERIEVITNPSAQFSSEGAGGVINLILRKTSTEGLSGNASMESSSYGHGLADTTLNYKVGDWTYQIKAGGNIGIMTRRSYNVQRSVQSQIDSAAMVNRERGLFTYEGTVGRLSGKATYKLDSKTNLSAQLGGGGGHDIVTDKVRYLALTPGFRPFYERRRMDSFGSYLVGDFNLDHKGAKNGEALNASIQFYTNPEVHNVTQARFSDARSYRIELDAPERSIDAKIDWKHPMAIGQILSLGASWNFDEASQNYRFTSTGEGVASFGPDITDVYEGRSDTFAAYISFQQKFGALTLAPGLRSEINSRRISGDDSKVISTRRQNLFPSFHANYKMSKALQIGVSYSKRIDRAPLDYLRPYETVEDVYSSFAGNPSLKDQSTDAFEASVQFRRGKFETSGTLYLRKTDSLWSKNYSLNAEGASAYTYVNAGSRWSSGAQFDLAYPILPRLKASASANLFNERTPVSPLTGQSTQKNFRYSTNGTLEWNGKDRGPVPGDVAQLQWSYNGPSREYQVFKPDWFDFSLSYTRNIERDLSLSATFRYLSRTRERLIAPLIEEISSRQRTPEIQLKLLRARSKSC